MIALGFADSTVKVLSIYLYMWCHVVVIQKFKLDPQRALITHKFLNGFYQHLGYYEMFKKARRA